MRACRRLPVMRAVGGTLRRRLAMLDARRAHTNYRPLRFAPPPPSPFRHGARRHFQLSRDGAALTRDGPPYRFENVRPADIGRLCRRRRPAAGDIDIYRTPDAVTLEATRRGPASPSRGATAGSTLLSHGVGRSRSVPQSRRSPIGLDDYWYSILAARYRR